MGVRRHRETTLGLRIELSTILEKLEDEDFGIPEDPDGNPARLHGIRRPGVAEGISMDDQISAEALVRFVPRLELKQADRVIERAMSYFSAMEKATGWGLPEAAQVMLALGHK